MDRREQALEDNSVMIKAPAGKATPQQALDYYLSWVLNPAQSPKFTPLQAENFSFMKNWGLTSSPHLKEGDSNGSRFIAPNVEGSPRCHDQSGRNTTYPTIVPDSVALASRFLPTAKAGARSRRARRPPSGCCLTVAIPTGSVRSY